MDVVFIAVTPMIVVLIAIIPMVPMVGVVLVIVVLPLKLRNSPELGEILYVQLFPTYIQFSSVP